jgi:hypothetical protein
VSLTVAPIDDYSTLWVASYDAAGNTSPATPLALENADGGPASEPADATYHWWLPQSSGSPLPSVLPDQNTTVETDLTLGDGLPLDATDAIGYQTDVPVLSFPGTITSATRAHTDSAAVDTTQSFTASAWVKPADSSGTMAVLAQSGASDSGFVLEDVAGHMTFCVKSQIGSGAADCATYGIASPANSWVMVTGIWDAGNHQVRIVVGSDMSAVAFASHVPPSGDVTAGGVVTVGSAQAGGVSVSAWNGEIASALVIQEAGDSYLLNYLGGLFY